MTTLNFYFTEKKLETLLDTLRKKQMKGVGITAIISDDTDNYGNNVVAFVSQTKEQREAKTEKFYVGNGKVVYTNSPVKVADKVELPAKAQAKPAQEEPFIDLPF